MKISKDFKRSQNPNESYTNKYQKHVACSYGYDLYGYMVIYLASLLNHT